VISSLVDFSCLRFYIKEREGFQAGFEGACFFGVSFLMTVA
jgi:hypothetical protein